MKNWLQRNSDFWLDAQLLLVHSSPAWHANLSSPGSIGITTIFCAFFAFSSSTRFRSSLVSSNNFFPSDDRLFTSSDNTLIYSWIFPLASWEDIPRSWPKPARLALLPLVKKLIPLPVVDLAFWTVSFT